MIKDLIKFATHLDSIGLTKEADYVDRLVLKLANDDNFNEEGFENLTIRASKEVLNAFFGVPNLFRNVYDNEQMSANIGNRRDKIKDSLMADMMRARDRVFDTPTFLSVQECSDEGCLPICFVKKTSKMENPRYRATVKIKCNSDKSEITLISSVEKV